LHVVSGESQQTGALTAMSFKRFRSAERQSAATGCLGTRSDFKDDGSIFMRLSTRDGQPVGSHALFAVEFSRVVVALRNLAVGFSLGAIDYLALDC